MGTSFFWFYDIVLLAVIAGVTFRGLKKGGVAVIISTVSIAIAFISAFIGSKAISESVYNSYIKEPLTGYIDAKIDEVIGDNIVTDLGKIDMSKSVIGGKFLSTIELVPNSSGKILLDLSDIDLTETGIENVDFSMFGIDENFDYSLVKVGNVEITERELKNNNIESIVLARVLTANIKSGEIFAVFEAIGEKISEAVPFVFKNYSAEISDGDSDIIYALVLSVIDFSYETRSEAILANIVDPIVVTPMRIILFLLIFAVVAIILEMIANATKIINHIPVLSSVNEFLGGVLGLIKAIIILLIICIAVQFLISVTNDSLVFINTYTIDKTLFFKYIYNFDLINFIETHI